MLYFGVEIQESIAFVEDVGFFVRQERTGHLTVPVRDQDLEVLAWHIWDLKLAEIEQVREQVSLRENNTLIPKIIKEGMQQGINWFDTLLRLIDKQLWDQVDSIDIGFFREDLEQRTIIISQEHLRDPMAVAQSWGNLSSCSLRSCKGSTLR